MRARRTFGAVVIEDVTVRAMRVARRDRATTRRSTPPGRPSATAGSCRPIVAADLTRRGELLTAHLRDAAGARAAGRRARRRGLRRRRDHAVRDGGGPGARQRASSACSRRRRQQPRVRRHAGAARRPSSARRRHAVGGGGVRVARRRDGALERVPIARVVHVVEPASLRPSVAAVRHRALVRGVGLRARAPRRRGAGGRRRPPIAPCCAIPASPMP